MLSDMVAAHSAGEAYRALHLSLTQLYRDQCIDHNNLLWGGGYNQCHDNNKWALEGECKKLEWNGIVRQHHLLLGSWISHALREDHWNVAYFLDY